MSPFGSLYEEYGTVRLYCQVTTHKIARGMRLLGSSLVLWAQSTAKDYIRAEHKFQYVSKLSGSQVIIPQVSFFSNQNPNSTHNFGTQTQKNNNTRYGACSYSAGILHGNLYQAGWSTLFCWPTQGPVLATANPGKTRERVWKRMQVNGQEG